MWGTETTSTDAWMGQGWTIRPHHVPTWLVPVDPPAAHTEPFACPPERGLVPGQVQLRSHPDEEDISWFDSQCWQASENRVDEYIRRGQVQRYSSVEDLIGDLHRRVAEQEQGADREDRAVRG